MLISVLITAQLFLGALLKSAGLFVVATFVFDAIHFSLHLCLKSRYRWLRRLARPHEAHHAFFDRRLRYHEKVAVPNLVHHVIPEYATQMVVCGLALLALQPVPVIVVMSIFTAIFAGAMVLHGKDHNHIPFPIVPVARGTLFVRAPYHAMHHIYPDSYLSSYTTLFDGLMGTACQVKGRRVALTGASGSFGSAIKDLLERAGASVVPLRFGVDWNYEDYSGTDAVLQSADILVLAHGAKGEQAMQANCDSFLALIDRFKGLTRNRPGSSGGLGRRIGNRVPSLLRRCRFTVIRPLEASLCSGSGQANARPRASLPPCRALGVSLAHGTGPDHRTQRRRRMLPFWLIRRGFRYVPVTYTGIAFLNFIPFVLRGLHSRADVMLRVNAAGSFYR